MKILFVAVFNPNSTNTSQSESFKTNGHEVIEFNYRERMNVLGSNSARDEQLINVCHIEKPDVVIFSKCNEISFRVVDECNKVSKTILWYMDPVNTNFNQSLIEKIKRCDYTFCALWDSYMKAKDIGGNKVNFLHEGYDQTTNYPMDIPYEHDVTFIGQLREHRGNYLNHYSFKVINNAYAEQHSVAVSSSKINLNFTHGGTSDRTYKVLASKGFLLTESWPKMDDDFTIGKDLVVFNNPTDMVNKINYYLTHENERTEIANNGYNTVQKFSRLNWAKKIIQPIIG